jgi:hypothetical protein
MTTISPGRRAQHALHGCPDDLGSRRALHGHDRLEALGAQRAQHGHLRAVNLRHAPDDPCPARGAAIEACQGQLDARCIDALQAPAIARGEPLAVDCPGRLDARGTVLAPHLFNTPETDAEHVGHNPLGAEAPLPGAEHLLTSINRVRSHAAKGMRDLSDDQVKTTIEAGAGSLPNTASPSSSPTCMKLSCSNLPEEESIAKTGRG